VYEKGQGTGLQAHFVLLLSELYLPASQQRSGGKEAAASSFIFTTTATIKIHGLTQI
jgi:hypothetical protein